VSNSVEALCTVASMKQKGLVALDETELIAEAFDLSSNVLRRSV